MRIVGVVGRLQLDVLAARTKAEYGIAVDFDDAPYETARWISSEDRSELERFIAEDRDGAPIFLARSNWLYGYTVERWPRIEFAATRERSPVDD